MQLRDVPRVEGKRHCAVILSVHDEVGRNLLDAMSHHLAHGRSRLGVELAQFLDERLVLQVGQFQHLLQPVPVLLGEQFEVVFYRSLHQLFQMRRLATLYL